MRGVLPEVGERGPADHNSLLYATVDLSRVGTQVHVGLNPRGKDDLQLSAISGRSQVTVEDPVEISEIFRSIGDAGIAMDGDVWYRSDRTNLIMVQGREGSNARWCLRQLRHSNPAGTIEDKTRVSGRASISTAYNGSKIDHKDLLRSLVCMDIGGYDRVDHEVAGKGLQFCY
ncbi:hypothetical protein NE237_005946 [Protea cynaroides]|uniref:Uncharacterized protein n=1 Tax=Protea cynaroides TaxID=273540 RepID=A0A9Q0KLE6_9MAGN|nr:hypothetical protein NE237_005946 [Protea cynaroides]